MERITKVFFDPLASTKEQVQHILTDLPVGSAHPFSPERILLLRTTGGIEEIDISAYPDEYFFNAIDLGEIGETLQRRMAGFSGYLSITFYFSFDCILERKVPNLGSFLVSYMTDTLVLTKYIRGS